MALAGHIGDVSIAMKVNAAGVNAGLNKGKGDLDSFQKKMAGGSFDLNSLTTGLGSLIGMGTGVGAALAVVSIATDLVKEGFKLAFDAATQLAYGLGYLIFNAVQAYAEFEQLTISLTVMTGSAARANAVIKDLVNFAQTTPFELRGLAQAVRLLTAYGFSAEESLGITKRLAGFAAAAGGNLQENLQLMALAIGQIRAAGKVMGTEIRQLAERGVPVWEALANKLAGGDTAKVRQMVEAGMVGADEGIRAIMEAAADPKFANQLLEQSKSINGMWSNFKDAGFMALVSIGKKIDETFNVRGIIGDLSDLIGIGINGFGSWEPLFNTIGMIFKTLWIVGIELLKEFLTWMGKAGEQFNLAGANSEQMRNRIIDSLEGIVTFFTFSAATAMHAWGVVFEKVFAPIAEFFGFMSKKMVDAMVLMTQLNPIAARMAGITDEVINGARAMADMHGDMPQVWRDVGRGLQQIDADRAVAGVHDVFARIRQGIAEQLGKPFDLGELKLKIPPNLVRANAIIKDMQTPFEKYMNRMTELDSLLNSGALTAEQYLQAVGDAFSDLDKTMGKVTTKGPEAFAQGSAQAFSAIAAFDRNNNRQNADPQKRIEDVLKQSRDLHFKQVQELQDVGRRIANLNIGVVE